MIILGKLSESARAVAEQWQLRTLRRLPRIFTVTAGLLFPWMLFLVIDVPGRLGARDFANSWIGLDIMEIGALLLIASAVRRRHRATSPLAAATAVVFALDAYFDVMSAAPKMDYLIAELMSYLAELPLATTLGWLAWYTLRWAGPQSPTVGTDCDLMPGRTTPTAPLTKDHA